MEELNVIKQRIEMMNKAITDLFNVRAMNLTDFVGDSGKQTIFELQKYIYQAQVQAERIQEELKKLDLI